MLGIFLLFGPLKISLFRGLNNKTKNKKRSLFKNYFIFVSTFVESLLVDFPENSTKKPIQIIKTYP